VRSFARDLAERLGTVGIAAEIRRNAVGPVTVEDALPLDQLIQNDADPPICPVERLLSLPTARIRNEDYQELMLGRRPLIPELPEGESMLINPGGEICGVVSRDSTGGFTVRFMVNLLPT
jgi:tRNA U55 pseudouridine synthase TruB